MGQWRPSQLPALGIPFPRAWILGKQNSLSMPLVVAVMMEPPRSAKEESRPFEMTQDLTLVFGDS